MLLLLPDPSIHFNSLNSPQFQALQLQAISQEILKYKKLAKNLQTQIEAHQKINGEQLIWAANKYNAKGAVVSELFGNGLINDYSYTIGGLVKSIRVHNVKNIFANVNYEYDIRGNLIKREFNKMQVQEHFAYDNEDRIINWILVSPNKTIQRSYQYDIYGNIIYKSDVGAFTYNNKNQIISAPSALGYFSYDANGNMLNGNKKSYLYDNENHVVRIEYNNHKAYEEYLYDDNENIIRSNNSKGELTYKLGDYEVTFKEENFKKHILMYHKIFANGKEVALHIKHLIDGEKQVDRTLYFHKDNLNSTILISDNIARILQRDLYSPFGQKINLSKAPNELFRGIIINALPSFTNHQSLNEANVIIMKSRVYDPIIARFTSPDTIVPNVNMAVAFNRYAYVYNNPLKYIDPDGHFPWLFLAGAALFTIGATSDNAIVKTLGMTIGGLMMGGALHNSFHNAFLEGAIRGFSQTLLSGGDISQIFTNTITGGLNASITNGLPDILNNGDHGFGFGLMIGHGIIQGAISAIRGGKFKTGLISGMVSKVSGVLINTTSLSNLASFAKMSIVSIISGAAAKASGGDFVQGALSAMVVWLYNEIDVQAELYGIPIDKEKPEKGLSNSLQAIIRYFEGDGKPAQLSKSTIEALVHHPLVQRQIKALKNGTAKHLQGNLSVDLTFKIFHVGDTGVVFNTYCSNSVCTTYFIGFVQAEKGGSVATRADSFSDPLDLGVEIPGGTPYEYIPYTWSITYKNNFHKE